MSQPSAPPSFLGTGWSFPPEFGLQGADVAMVADFEDIHQSLQLLLSTRLGERPMQESFGCSLDELLFEPVGHALVNRLTVLIENAVLRHETRVELLAVDVSVPPDQDHTVAIRLDYRVLGTNSRYNMVFPFYLNEANAPSL